MTRPLARPGVRAGARGGLLLGFVPVSIIVICPITSPLRDYLPRIGPQEGRVFHTRRICTAFERAVERAKLENFQVQDSRHTFASWLVMTGISLQAVKGLPGHSSLTMTMRYAHLSPAHLREAVAKLDARAGADGLTPAAAAPRVGEFSTISARRVSAAVESGGDCRGTS